MDSKKCKCDNPEKIVIANFQARSFYKDENILIHGVDLFFCKNCQACWVNIDLDKSIGD